MLADPSGNLIDVGVINALSHRASGTTVTGTNYTDKRYIDVLYLAPSGVSLDYTSVLDTEPEFTLRMGTGPALNVEGVPLPLETLTEADGSTTFTVLVPNADDLANGATAEQALINAIKRTGTNRFRYFITGGGFTIFPRGELHVDFTAGSFNNAEVTTADGNVQAGAASELQHLVAPVGA